MFSLPSLSSPVTMPPVSVTLLCFPSPSVPCLLSLPPRLVFRLSSLSGRCPFDSVSFSATEHAGRTHFLRGVRSPSWTGVLVSGDRGVGAGRGVNRRVRGAAVSGLNGRGAAGSYRSNWSSPRETPGDGRAPKGLWLLYRCGTCRCVQTPATRGASRGRAAPGPLALRPKGPRAPGPGQPQAREPGRRSPDGGAPLLPGHLGPPAPVGFAVV